MRTTSLPLLSLFVLGTAGSLQAAEPLAASLPGETKVFFSVSNLTNVRKVSSHPLLKSLTDGEVGKALKPLIDKAAGEADAETNALLKEETGLTLAELLAKFPGAAAAGLNIDFAEAVKEDTMDHPPVGITLLADYTGDETLMQKMLAAFDKLEEKAAVRKAKEAEAEEKKADDGEEEEEDEDEKDLPEANWPGDYEETVTEIGGAKVHEWKVRDEEKMDGDPMSWAVSGGKAALTIGKSDLKEMVTRLSKATEEGSLKATPAWKTMPDSLQDSDLLTGVNLESLLGEIQEGLRLKMEKGQVDTGGLPINPLQVWTGLGLDQFRMAFVDTNLEGDAAAIHVGLTYAEKPALLKIYAANGPGTPPAFVPSDVQEIAWGTMDWGKMFDGIKELATAVSPMAAGGIEVGLTEIKKKIGVDLRTDLLGQMGDDLWSVSHLDPEDAAEAAAAAKKNLEKEEKDDGEEEDDEEASGNQSLSALALTGGQSQVIGIALRDSKAFALSLKSMFNTLAPGEGLFEEREYLGKTIHQFKGTPPGMVISWLIHNDTWIFSVGKPGLLEKVLGGMDKKPANPLILEPHVQAALAKLPEGGVSSSYANAGQMIDLVFKMIKPVLLDQAEGEAAETLKNLPDQLNLPWHLVSRMYLGDKSTDVRIRLSAKP